MMKTMLVAAMAAAIASAVPLDTVKSQIATTDISSTVDDLCHAKYTTQKTCDADTTTTGGCTWCECAAVPSACWEMTNAAKLPRGVYTCDKNKPTDESKPEIKTSLLKTSDDLIGAVNKIVNGIVASS